MRAVTFEEVNAINGGGAVLDGAFAAGEIYAGEQAGEAIGGIIGGAAGGPVGAFFGAMAGGAFAMWAIKEF